MFSTDFLRLYLFWYCHDSAHIQFLDQHKQGNGQVCILKGVNIVFLIQNKINLVRYKMFY